MKIIADSNTFLAVALEEPEKKRIIELTVGHDLVAPEVLPFEIGNALTAMMKKRTNEADEMTSMGIYSKRYLLNYDRSTSDLLWK
jgi:hypothetical protein